MPLDSLCPQKNFFKVACYYFYVSHIVYAQKNCIFFWGGEWKWPPILQQGLNSQICSKESEEEKELMVEK